MPRCPTSPYAALACVALTLILAAQGWTQGTFKILHNFGGLGDGYHPYGVLVFDNNGNLYGTAANGPGTGCDGNQGCGMVFKLKPNADGTWIEEGVHFFDGTDGSTPVAGPVFDHRGGLYGTTYLGGARDYGTVFKLTPTSGGSWVLSTLYSFTSVTSGVYPFGGVSFDGGGHLYGTTEYGGAYNNGMVFNLGPVSVFNWYEIIAHAFAGGRDGAVPYSSLIFNVNGNAYGTTHDGGAKGVGTVFKLAPNKMSFGWTETVLHSFAGISGCGSKSPDGAGPVAPLALDSTGNLYGTTECGGAGGYGTVFELTHNPDDSWTESVIYAFQGGNDGEGPTASVTFDQAGNLYGTTGYGGPHGYGTVYKLTFSNGQWTESILHAFSYSGGALPYAGVILDNSGNLYGTAVSGGPYGPDGGVTYELTP